MAVFVRLKLQKCLKPSLKLAAEQPVKGGFGVFKHRLGGFENGLGLEKIKHTKAINIRLKENIDRVFVEFLPNDLALHQLRTAIEWI